MSAARASARYPYRAVEEVEDNMARAEAVAATLHEQIARERDPDRLEELRRREKQARALHAWLVALRDEMKRQRPH